MANNFAEAMQQGYAFGARQRQEREQRNRLAELQGLAPKVIGGDLDATNRAFVLDPNMAQTYQSEGERRRENLVGLARGWKQVPTQHKQAYYERFVAPTISAMGFGDAGPYDQTTVDGVADQILAAYGSASRGNVQSTYVDDQGRRIAIMRDGTTRELGMAEDSYTLRDHPGMSPERFSRRHGQLSPIEMDGQPQGVAPGSARAPLPPGGGQMFVEDSLALANQMIAAGIPAAQVDAFLQQRMNPAPAAQAPVAPQGGPRLNYTGGGLARPSEAQTAAQVEAARLQTQLQYEPEIAGRRIMAEAAANAASADQQGQVEGTRVAAREMAEGAVAELGAMRERARLARTENNRMRSLEQALSDTYTGPGANQVLGLRRIAATFGIPTEGLAEAETARALSNQLALGMRNPAGGEGMPGAMSDADRNFLVQSVPGLSNTPEGWRQLIRMRVRLNDATIAQAQEAERLRREGVPVTEIPGRIQDFANRNPIFSNGTVNEAQDRGAPVRRPPAQRARNPQTGEVLELRNGQWVPIR